MKIKITFNEQLTLEAELYETATAQKVLAALPVEGTGSTWGEEIYFPSSIEDTLNNPKEVLEPGEIAYWPPMKAICIFFGPTPASHGQEIRAAGPVNVFGKVKGNLSALKNLKEPVSVVLENV
ncbi:MAG: hypothetical protein GX996_06040 [Firmicutes bacterium]|nr:hypothetical protein [Bacillota bacterium]